MKNLQEIIEDLAQYCKEAGVDSPCFSIVLPKQAQDKYSESFEPRDLKKLAEAHPVVMRRLYVTSGVCNIYNTDDQVIADVKKEN